MVSTVTGPVAPEALGLTLAHEHIPRNIVPMLRHEGIPQSVIQDFLVGNPRRLFGG